MAGLRLPAQGCLAGRVWRPGIGPALVTLRDHAVIDVTSPEAPTMRDLLERDDPAGWLAAQPGTPVCALDDLAAAGPGSSPGADDLRLLSPADLAAIKASGVTFADSMVERVIEEQAAGNPGRAAKYVHHLHEHSGDLVRVQLACGRRFRVLNGADDVTRDCLAAIPDTSISGRCVARKLAARIASSRYSPIRSQPSRFAVSRA